MRLRDVIKAIEEFAPPELAEAWDNCGLLVEGRTEVNSISVILDPTVNTLDSAKGDLILSHHPLIFSPLKSIEHDIKRKIKILLSKEQSFYAAHTTLDFAPQGVSWVLAQKIGLQEDDDSSPRMRTGTVPYGTVQELTDVVRIALEKKVLRVVGEKESIGRMAALPGSGFSEDIIDQCYDMGIETILSGDLKHHTAIKGMDLDMTLIDAGHRETEVPGIQYFAGYLEKHLKDVEIELIKPTKPWHYEIDQT